MAIRAAVGQRGVAVVVIPGDMALKDALDAPAPRRAPSAGPSLVRPADRELDRLAALLNASAITLLCGRAAPARMTAWWRWPTP